MTDRPVKQVGAEIRELTDDELGAFLADAETAATLIPEPEPTPEPEEETPTE